MIYLGYFFTALNYVAYCCSRFFPTKLLMLFGDLIAKIFTVLGLYCLGSLSGAWGFVITFFMLIVANLKEKYHKQWLMGYVIFQGLYILVLFYYFEGISSVLVVVSLSINLICVWFLNPQKMRFIGGLNSVLYLTYQLIIKNWAGLLEIVVIYSNFKSFYKYRVKPYIRLSKSKKRIIRPLQ